MSETINIDEIIDEAERMTKGWTKNMLPDVEISPQKFHFLLKQPDARLTKVNMFITDGNGDKGHYELYNHILSYKGFKFNAITNGKFEDYQRWQKQ